MRIARSLQVASLLAALLSSLLFASSALAGEPASGTVRVEGGEGQTLLPQTVVQTTTTPVPVEGGTCPGTSVGGALYDAVHGNWKAIESPEGVEILGIDGVDLPRFGSSEIYAFWEIWLNDVPATAGGCGVEMTPGQDVVYELQCFGIGTYCASSESAPEHFLTSTAPTRSIVDVDEPVSVTIGSISTSTNKAEPSLPAGVLVTAGSTSQTPGAGGVSTFTFTTPGIYTLQARGPSSVPSDPFTVCVHNGEDGNCGTTGPGGTTATGSTGVAGFKESSIYRGAYALVPKPSVPLNADRYTLAQAPRLLSGTILSHSAVTSVKLELRRSYRGRCSAFDGTRARFVHERCGVGTAFTVPAAASYSYLLPATLPKGRYVLDVLAADAVGNRTTLARGTSRIVFYVS
jgi:hypothetical protein